MLSKLRKNGDDCDNHIYNDKDGYSYIRITVIGIMERIMNKESLAY